MSDDVQIIEPITFTPGPLAVQGPSNPEPGKSDGGDYAIVDGDGKIVGEAIYQVDHDAFRPALANAVLWSQAPQLLDALEQCERTLSAMCKKVFGLQAKCYGGRSIGEVLGYTQAVISKTTWRP